MAVVQEEGNSVAELVQFLVAEAASLEVLVAYAVSSSYAPAVVDVGVFGLHSAEFEPVST